MNTLRSFYSNVLYAKASNLTVPTDGGGGGPGHVAGVGGGNDKKRRKSSSKSLSNISDNFIRAVENMESVVLIPTKLLDIPVAGDMTIPDLISSGHSNLYDIYKSIRGFKDKLTTLNVTDDDEDDSEDNIMAAAAASGPSSASTFDVDDIIANLTASLSEQGLLNNNVNTMDNSNSIQVKEPLVINNNNNNNNNNNLVSLNGGQIVTGQIIGQMVNGNVIPTVTVTPGKLKSVPSAPSMGDNHGAKSGGGDSNSGGQQQQQQQHDYCDSGVWSSEGGGSSRDSIDDVSDECISFADPSGTSSPTGRLSVEPNQADNRSRKMSAPTRGSYGLHNGLHYHRQQIMSAASRYVVKKSLSSAKGFCSFLIELTQVTESVITKYMEEIECQDENHN